MNRPKLFKILSYLVISIFIINFIAVKLYWYYDIWWFDMPMHFFGGVFLGFALLWLSKVENISQKSLWSIFYIMLGVLLVGVGWEVFEIVVNNLIAHNAFNTLDTISDVCFDMAGGFSALLYYYKVNMLQLKNGQNS